MFRPKPTIPVVFRAAFPTDRVAFKPVATILQTQTSIDVAGTEIQVEGKGRHDPCVLPRAVPIVEAMAALVLADFMLRAQVSKV